MGACTYGASVKTGLDPTTQISVDRYLWEDLTGTPRSWIDPFLNIFTPSTIDAATLCSLNLDDPPLPALAVFVSALLGDPFAAETVDLFIRDKLRYLAFANNCTCDGPSGGCDVAATMSALGGNSLYPLDDSLITVMRDSIRALADVGSYNTGTTLRQAGPGTGLYSALFTGGTGRHAEVDSGSTPPEDINTYAVVGFAKLPNAATKNTFFYTLGDYAIFDVKQDLSSIWSLRWDTSDGINRDQHYIAASAAFASIDPTQWFCWAAGSHLVSGTPNKFVYLRQGSHTFTATWSTSTSTAHSVPNRFGYGGYAGEPSSLYLSNIAYLKSHYLTVAEFETAADCVLTGGVSAPPAPVVPPQPPNLVLPPDWACVDLCSITARLQQISERLDWLRRDTTLVQRRTLPFAWILGTTSATLSGAGSITVQDCLGALVHLTTVPVDWGSSTDTPRRLFPPAGSIQGSDGTGNVDAARPIEFEHQVVLWLDVWATQLVYNFKPGVQGTITPLRPEP